MDLTVSLWKPSIAEPARSSYGALALSVMSIMALAPTLCSGNVATKSVVIDVDTEVGGIDFSPDGKRLAIDSHGNGGTDIWDFAKRGMVGHVKDGGVQVWVTDVVHFSPDGRQLVICSNRLSIYDTATWTPKAEIIDSEHGAKSSRLCGDGLAFSPDGRSLVALSGNLLLFYDTSTWDVTKSVRTVKWPNVDAKVDSTRVDLRDPNDSEFTFISQGGSLSFSKDGRYLALGGYSFSKKLKLWHPGDGEMPPDIPKTIVVDLSANLVSKEYMGGVAAIDRSPDGANIAVGASDAVYTIKIFDTASGEIVASEKEGPAHVLLRYTPDGKYLIESIRKKVEIWDGRHEHLLQVIHAEPSCIAVSHDSHYFALGGAPFNILDATAMLSLITHPNGSTGKVIVYKLK
jgi:WD40 repeat protein